MIIALLVAATVTAAPAAPNVDIRNLLSGAEHAIRVNRLDQAKVMVGRAIAAGASGSNLEHALADLAYASGKNVEALARYKELLKLAPSDQSLLEPAGIAALTLGNYDEAFALLSRATSAPAAGWRAWNALGVVADFRTDWQLADRCYAKASALSPREAAPVNNHGWSLLLRGKWNEALAVLETAVAMDAKSQRARDNLELARAALSADLPEREPGESASDWAARLNDAGVAAEILGDQKRATAAFSRALEASDTWYPRAANNLEALGSR
jgi:Flp pilus assembly protein TadD